MLMLKANTEKTKYDVLFLPNEKHIGDIIREIDGDYVFYPIQDGGAWSGPVMMEIAIKLFLLNNTDFNNAEQEIIK